MSALTNFARNKFVDAILRSQSLAAPATMYIGLLVCSKGVVARSTAYALNDTAIVQATDGKYHLYKATTAGSTALSAPTYAGAAGEVITDGTAVFTEQMAALQAGTAQAEPAAASYARVPVTSSLLNWAGTQGAGTTAASSGTTGTTSNNNAVNFPAPNENWASGSALAWGYCLYDAPTGGNAWIFAPLNAPKTINAGDAAPSFAAGVLIVAAG